MTDGLRGYLFFLLMAGCAAVSVLFMFYLLAIIEVAIFFFSTLSLGVGSG